MGLAPTLQSGKGTGVVVMSEGRTRGKMVDGSLCFLAEALIIIDIIIIIIIVVFHSMSSTILLWCRTAAAAEGVATISSIRSS